MRATTVSIASAVVRWVDRIAGMDYSEAARISRGFGGAGVRIFIPNTVGRIRHIPDIRRATTNVRWEITTTNDWLLTYSTYKKNFLNFTAFISNPNAFLNAKKTASLSSDWCWGWDMSEDHDIVNLHRLDTSRIRDSRLNIYSGRKLGTTSFAKGNIHSPTVSNLRIQKQVQGKITGTSVRVFQCTSLWWWWLLSDRFEIYKY